MLIGSFLLWLRGTLRSKLLLCMMLGYFLLNEAQFSTLTGPRPIITLALNGALFLFCVVGLALTLATLRRNAVNDSLGTRYPRTALGVYLIFLTVASLAPWLFYEVVPGVTDVVSQAVQAGGRIGIGFNLAEGFVIASTGASGFFAVGLGAPSLITLILVAAIVLVFAKNQGGYFLFGLCVPAVLKSAYVVIYSRLLTTKILVLGLALVALLLVVLLSVRLGRPKPPVIQVAEGGLR